MQRCTQAPGSVGSVPCTTCATTGSCGNSVTCKTTAHLQSPSEAVSHAANCTSWKNYALFFALPLGPPEHLKLRRDMRPRVQLAGLLPRVTPGKGGGGCGERRDREGSSAADGARRHPLRACTLTRVVPRPTLHTAHGTGAVFSLLGAQEAPAGPGTGHLPAGPESASVPAGTRRVHTDTETDRHAGSRRTRPPRAGPPGRPDLRPGPRLRAWR